jgi:hypothetical protein
MLLALLSLGLAAGCSREGTNEVASPDADMAAPAAAESGPVAPPPRAGFTEAEVAAVSESDPHVVLPTPEGMFALEFSVNGSPAGDTRILALNDGPCGLGVTAAVAAIPLADPLLVPDLVVEFDDNGEVRRWAVPYEAQLLELDGDRLAFRTGYAETGPTFWTHPDGRLEPTHDLPTRLETQAAIIDCPIVPAFAGSGYLQCVEVADQGGHRRRLAWEGRCT